ncbi:MAG TPA: hypothetical protein VMU87_04670 [Stellaceae bacterium]|nr:hypothetical protein [Stellaceae bacterium]
MKARLPVRPFETRNEDDAPFRYWGAALVLAACCAWAIPIGAMWLAARLI